MSIQIIPKENQASGFFAGGAILENKPIGFPQDEGAQKPYSNLFYWANAWSYNGGLIGEHPHKMFEIMSFVIEGEIEHYDNKFDRWITLRKGDAQIIRSGNGITHAEKLLKGSRMFQVWFDPNIKKSMLEYATYDDCKSENMKYIDGNRVSFKHYVGNGGPMKMDSEGVEIKEITFFKGNHQLEIDENKIYSYYVLNGKATIEEEEVLENDFIKIENETKLNIVANSETRLFEIIVPRQLTYKTYLEHLNY